MSAAPLQVYPIPAPVQRQPFDLDAVLMAALDAQELPPQTGDVIALSSKYLAIAEGRIVDLHDIQPREQARELAQRYHMDARVAQLVVDEADHIFGGIPMGFLLTWRDGVIAPNAGLDRSNIPSGQAVLLPDRPYEAARRVRHALEAHYGVKLGVILTDSWLVPGRYGTTGVALAAAGFEPVQDERGKSDLFGNPMAVTQRGVADSLSVCAQVVMGERDEATPIALIRNANVTLTDAQLDADSVAIPWQMCLYVESLTVGLLPGGAPSESHTAHLSKRDLSGA